MEGVCIVVPTPLDEDEVVDLRGLLHLVDHFIDAGCHGLLVLGSGGELPYLTFAEKVTIARAVIERARGRVPVIVGAAFHAVVEMLAFARAVDDVGPDGYLVALPTYHPVSPDAALAAFEWIARSTRTPLYYYHFPQVTGLRLSGAQLARILRLDSVVGVKESTVRLGEVRAHLRAVDGAGCRVYAGTTFLLRDSVALGAAGVICPVAAVVPAIAMACYAATCDGGDERARALQARIQALLPLMSRLDRPAAMQRLALAGLSRSPVPVATGRASRQAVIKEALRQLGHPITARVRSPLPQISPADRARVAQVLASIAAPGRAAGESSA